MPNRVIKDSINESESLSECSMFAQDLYKRLITYADDYGRFNSDTAIMRARLYPREFEEITEEDIIDALSELAGVGKISFYRPQYGLKGVYGVFPNWGEHQRLRETKAKFPEPYDTSINDWYLRRFVPLSLKVDILERDNFKCCICGKYLTSCRDAKRFVKLQTGLFHIDHIVPVQQGGRASLENLRLTCPECNLKRKKKFTFKEVLEEKLAELDNLPQPAATCSNSRPESESESEKNPNRNPNESGRAKRFTPPTVEEVSAYVKEQGYHVDPQRFIDYYQSNGWKVGKNSMKDWKAAVRTWEQKDKPAAKLGRNDWIDEAVLK